MTLAFTTQIYRQQAPTMCNGHSNNASAAKEQRQNMPRVPSLMFDMEIESESCFEGDIQDSKARACHSELHRLLLPQSTGEMKLHQDVDAGLRAVSRYNDSNGVSEIQLLAAYLACKSYHVTVKTATGGGEGTDCLRNLRHQFLQVRPPGGHASASTNKYIVDLSFKEQFSIAKPTPRYAGFSSRLPDVLVSSEAVVPALVNILCAEMSAAFQANDSVVPPWRCAAAMLSKWMPRKSCDEPVTMTEAAAITASLVDVGSTVHRGQRMASLLTQQASQSQQQQVLDRMRIQRALDVAAFDVADKRNTQKLQAPAMATGGMGFGIAAAAFNTSSHLFHSSGVKPLACEPKRVVVGGNFMAVGF